MIGTINNPVSYQSDLCDDPYMDKRLWMTQSRKLKCISLQYFYKSSVHFHK